MIFSSLFFLLFFLPLFLLLYFLVQGEKKQNIVLLIFSLVFYCWGGVRYVVLLAAMVFAAWLFGRLIENARTRKTQKILLAVSVAIFLAVLGFFKYTGFFLSIFGGLPGSDSPAFQIALPLGISFYTFKLISYVADVYHSRIRAEKSYLMLLTYTSMFHHAVAGPIVRYSTVQKELRHRKYRYGDIADGICRCCVGVAKKAILADHCGALAEQLLPVAGDIASVPASAVWLGSIFYMLQLYLDFSAYSDIAIGLGRICGFHFEENFNYPYMAVSVKDFWRRWHISLSSFFRDYVYIPLGGSRVSKRRLILNLLVVWALTGFWHGASWNYILWGLFFFAFIVLQNFWTERGMPSIPKILAHAGTLFIVFIGWIMFRFESFPQLGMALKGLFGLNGNPAGGSTVSITLVNNIFFLILAVLACTPLLSMLLKWPDRMTAKGDVRPQYVYIIRIAIAAALFVLAVIALVGNSYSPFLYYQF